MRFHLQQNVMCLVYQHPLLLDRSRGWAPKNHLLAVQIPQPRPPADNRSLTKVVPVDTHRFEGEDGSKAPVPARDLIAIPLDDFPGRRSAAP